MGRETCACVPIRVCTYKCVREGFRPRLSLLGFPIPPPGAPSPPPPRGSGSGASRPDALLAGVQAFGPSGLLGFRVSGSGFCAGSGFCWHSPPSPDGKKRFGFRVDGGAWEGGWGGPKSSLGLDPIVTRIIRGPRKCRKSCAPECQASRGKASEGCSKSRSSAALLQLLEDLCPSSCPGFGVEGLGFGVWGLGFRVWGLGFGV